MIRRVVTLLASIYIMIAEQVLRIISGWLLRRAVRQVLGG